MVHFDETLADQRAPERVPARARIPRQRLPRVVRVAVQAAVLPFVLLEEASLALLRIVFRPRYRREGGCQSSGACCKYIVIGAPRGGALFAGARRLTVWWAKEINGFYERDFTVDDAEYDTHVFSCRHLTAENRCDNYRLRPMVCRQWPRVNYFTASTVHKGCGFTIVENNPSASPEFVALNRQAPEAPLEQVEEIFDGASDDGARALDADGPL